jgi:hypothetical protein
MMDIIRSDSRGNADHGWLKSQHTFSFADYHNPAMMGFGSLRVINEDYIEPGQGFGTHPHKDMEIITYVIDGALEHKDSMGNGSVIRPGDVQRMTAGTGVSHSEYNHSSEDRVHLLQIWIVPEQDGLQPGYQQEFFTRDDKHNQWRLVGSRDGRGSSLTIHQDVDLYASRLESGHTLEHRFEGHRRGFLHVVAGAIELDGQRLAAGDALTISDQATLSLQATEHAELLLFDLA